MSEMEDNVRMVIHAGLAADLTIAEIARNVIKAMREPTEAMLEAGDAGMAKAGHDASEFAWPAMIDAALGKNVEVE